VQKKHCELRAGAFDFIDEKERIKKREERMGKEGFDDNDDNNH
jgi:hypothetical protein